MFIMHILKNPKTIDQLISRSGGLNFHSMENKCKCCISFSTEYRYITTKKKHTNKTYFQHVTCTCKAEKLLRVLNNSNPYPSSI